MCSHLLWIFTHWITVTITIYSGINWWEETSTNSCPFAKFTGTHGHFVDSDCALLLCIQPVGEKLWWGRRPWLKKQVLILMFDWVSCASMHFPAVDRSSGWFWTFSADFVVCFGETWNRKKAIADFGHPRSVFDLFQTVLIPTQRGSFVKIRSIRLQDRLNREVSETKKLHCRAYLAEREYVDHMPSAHARVFSPVVHKVLIRVV